MVAGGGFVPQALIDSVQLADSTMDRNAKKGRIGKLFIQFSFSSCFHRSKRVLLATHFCAARLERYRRGFSPVISLLRMCRSNDAPPVRRQDSCWLWLATSTHVLRMKRNELLGGKLTNAGLREYGLVDGLRSIAGIRRSSSVIGGPRGQIWFSTNRGISMVELIGFQWEDVDFENLVIHVRRSVVMMV